MPQPLLTEAVHLFDIFPYVKISEKVLRSSAAHPPTHSRYSLGLVADAHSQQYLRLSFLPFLFKGGFGAMNTSLDSADIFSGVFSNILV